MRWRCKKKKDIFFCCLWASLILYPLPSSLPLLFYSSRWLRDSIPAIFCPCRNSRTHQRERGWGWGGGWGRDSERDRRKGRGCQRETLAQKALYRTDEISKNQHKYTSNTLLVLQKNVWSCSVTFLLWCSGFCRCRADEAVAAPQLPTPSVWTES